VQPLQGPLSSGDVRIWLLNKKFLTVDGRWTVTLLHWRQLTVYSRCVEQQLQRLGCQLLTVWWVFVNQASRRHESADRGNVVHRHVEPLPAQPVYTEFVLEPAASADWWEHQICDCGSSGGRSVKLPHSGLTGVDLSGKPEGQLACCSHSPARSAPVQPRASKVWPMARSSESDIVQWSIVTKHCNTLSWTCICIDRW